jgi:putative tryptophan/tyrosine transport system substrate-binding protein
MTAKMKRRAFITLLGAALAWPLAARAQQGKLPRIGFIGLGSAADQASTARIDALRDGLRELGYLENKNIVIDARWADGYYERLTALVTQLIHLNVEAIVTHGTPATLAAKQTTTTVPVVMVAVSDAVGSGLVSSIAQPGGNITGMTFFNPELAVKRLELLKEAVPAATEVGVLLNSANPQNDQILPVIKQAGQALKVTVLQFAVRSPSEFDDAFAAMRASHVEALLVLDDGGMLITHAEPLAKLALRRGLPSAGFLEFGVAGGLLAYGVNIPDQFRRAATFVDKILKGAKPGELPVERPTRFKTILNLKTAKALGLTVPDKLLVAADEVIE